MQALRPKNHIRFLLSILLLIALPCLAAPPTGQDDTKVRDAWQRPEEVMNALQIGSGSVVADIGAGGGYFTFHLAERVGPKGKVYAEDIQEDEVKKVRARAEKEGLTQIEAVLGDRKDPKLPSERFDAILVVNAYHEMREYDAMLGAMLRALKPGGLLGIIDATTKAGEPREKYFVRHRIPEDLVREDTARNGFSFVRQDPGFKPPDDDRSYFFLIFKKPTSTALN